LTRFRSKRDFGLAWYSKRIFPVRNWIFEGIGKPEPLKHALSGYWSRRINDEHRIVYKALSDAILIAQLRYHY